MYYNRFPGIKVNPRLIRGNMPDVGFVLGEEAGGKEDERQGDKEKGRQGEDWAIGRLDD